MNAGTLTLTKAPIVEAVLDIDCELPPEFDLAGAEPRGRQSFGSGYNSVRKQVMHEHQIAVRPNTEPTTSNRRTLNALQFVHADGRQIVQVRTRGYSFNRLAPYTTLDDYLPEIKRTWECYVQLAAPVQIRAIRLRYINRILLPMAGGKVDLDLYFRVGPHLPDEERLEFAGFLNQHAAVEPTTGHQVNIVLTAQASEGDSQPVIFDNMATCSDHGEPTDWHWIAGKIAALRDLKNHVFRGSLTDRCIELFHG